MTEKIKSEFDQVEFSIKTENIKIENEDLVYGEQDSYIWVSLSLCINMICSQDKWYIIQNITIDGGKSNRFFQPFSFNNLLMCLLMCYLFILSSKQ